MENLRSLFGDPLVVAIGLYLVTLFGAIAMYVFGLQKGIEGSITFLRRVLPGKSETFYHRVDFALVSLLGSFIGLIVFTPTNAFQALAAGCGWVGALTMLLAGGTGRARQEGQNGD